MDLNHMLTWTVGAGCWITLLQLLGQKHALRPAVLTASILVTQGICLWLFPDTAGFIAGTLFLLLLLLPNWLGAAIHWLLMRRRYQPARILAGLVAVLHPVRDSRLALQLIRAMHLMKMGETDRAIELLNSIPVTGPHGKTALVLRTRFQGNWEAILAWAADPANMQLIREDPNLCDTYLQALGETGRRDELFVQFEQLQPALRKFHESVMNFVCAKIAAFSGDEYVVAQWLSGPLRELPIELKRYWRATAVAVSGRIAEATLDFEWLITHCDAGIAGSAERRQTNPLPTLAEKPLTPEQLAIIRRLSHLAEFEIQHGVVQLHRNRRAWATWSIALTLVLVFLCEIPGGTENMANLERMGAMLIPPDPDENGAWRMVAAAFLHFGPIHLIMNLLGLIVLGRQIERGWGSLLTIVTYLMAAIGSIGLSPWLISWGGEDEFTLLVGASGGVMGLFGGLLSQGFFNLLRGRSFPVFREFALLLAVVCAQLSFDASTPNVSSEAHLLGMTIGFLCGTVWNLVWWKRRGWR